jgi:hypothetical protein
VLHVRHRGELSTPPVVELLFVEDRPQVEQV